MVECGPSVGFINPLIRDGSRIGVIREAITLVPIDL